MYFLKPTLGYSQYLSHNFWSNTRSGFLKEFQGKNHIQALSDNLKHNRQMSSK